jgi:hypothetical protein
MTAWTSEELNRIGRAEELEIASLGRDGTLRRPVTIWVVRLGDDLYVRSVKGHAGAWFRGTRVRHEGRIDAAYRTKYRRYAASIVDSILTPQARTTTIKLVPRAAPQER